jgi:hypothetical protein
MLGGIPIPQWSGSGATDRLREVIEKFNMEASRQSKQMLVLTRWIAALTVVMVLAVFVQIYFAWRALPA